MPWGIQVSSFVTITIILLCYFRNKRMPLMSTRLFTSYLVMSLCNILFEIASLYTIYHIETVPSYLNRFTHQLFIGSLNYAMFFMFLYVEMKCRNQVRYSYKQLFVRAIPIILATLAIIFAPLDYHIDSQARYSYGMMAWSVYILSIVYLIWIVGVLFKHSQNHFSRESTVSIYISVTIWLMVVIVQFFNPEFLLSSLGVSIFAVFFYMTFENPKDFLDAQIENANNIPALLMMLQELLERHQRFYVLSVSLSHFEFLKNTLGYQEIPQLLNALAIRLENQFHQPVYHLDEQSLAVIISNVRQIGQPADDYEYHGNGIQITIHYQCFILSCPQLAHDPVEVVDVLHYMHQNTPHVGGLVWVNKDDVDKQNQVAQVEKRVQEAISQGAIDVYYQPIYSVESQSFMTVEALVRLKDNETLGYISPEIFIPILEKCGLINRLGDMVFEKVCQFVSHYRLFEKGLEYVEINLSSLQGLDESLPDRLKEFVEKYHIPPSYINLEMTETAAVDMNSGFLDNMAKMREYGFSFSMDDFGTGYSNLQKMAEAHFEIVKIDKSLLWPCFEGDNPQSIALLEGTITLIHRLSMKIVVEGVETKQQKDWLIDHGVDYLQGFYFSKPIPKDEYLKEFFQIDE